jgi:lysophospholipase L1-like esterase
VFRRRSTRRPELASSPAALLLLAAAAVGCGDTVPARARASSAEVVTAPSVSHAAARDSVEGTSAVGGAARLPPLPRAGISGTPFGEQPGGEEADPDQGLLHAPGSGSLGSGVASGALEDSAALRHFYESLARLDAGQSHDDVTVLHFGDSHTAADFETGPLRRALQARFGDGGRGFVAIGEPWKHYVQEGLRNGCTHDWTVERSHPTKASKGKLVGDGLYGLCGVALHTDRAGARAWGEYTAKASRIEVAYLARPRGGSFDVYIDGSRAGHVTTSAPVAASAWRPFAVSDGAHRVEVVATGDGDVRLFGAELDRDQVGVTYEALGINGARVTNVLAWDEAHMEEQIKHRDPDLVVLAYGTNESGDTDVPIDVYERQVVDLLGRVARAAPSASCMLLGPPDRAIHTREGWGTLPRILDIIATQRRVARAAGCAFFDQLEAMGGPGTIAQWAEEPQPRANRDRVHLTREGYSQLGNAVATELVRGYGVWRSETGLGAVEPSPGPVAGSAAEPSFRGR